MGNISFDEDTSQASRPASVTSSSGMTAFVQKVGLAKDEKEAAKVLLILAITGFLIVVGLGIRIFVQQPDKLDERDIQRIIQLQNAQL